MEFYGSIDLVSGSVTASAFSGSFVGDASGLTSIPASGVTGLNLSQIVDGDATASISTTGFSVNKNTQIQGNLSVTGSIVANEYIVSSSVIYMTTSFASGSSAFGNDSNDVHQFTGSVQITGSISLNGQAIGTGKLDETTFQSYTSSNNNRVSNVETSTGSLNSFTSSINTTIKNKLNSENVISGSIQVNVTGTTGYSTFSSSINTSIGDINSNLSSSVGSLSSSIATTTSNLSGDINSLSSSVATTTLNLSSSVATTTLNLSSSFATTTLNLSSSVATTNLSQNNRLDTIESRYLTTGSNLIKGTQTISGSIIPSVDNTYDLGSVTHQWRDLYLSSGSLYIDGSKVISSTAQELTFTTDNGQSIKILEGTTDNITLQTADGNIELKSSAGGNILVDTTNGILDLRGTIQVQDGNKLRSSGGTSVVFGDAITVSGSITTTGTINNIDIVNYSSSVSSKLDSLQTSTSSINSFTSSTNVRISALENESGSVRGTLNSFTSSTNNRVTSLESASSSIRNDFNTYTSSNDSTNTTQTNRLNAIESTTGSINTFTSSALIRLNTIESTTASLNTFTASIGNTINNVVNNGTLVSGSIQVNITGTTGYNTFSSSIATTTNNLSSSIATTDLNQNNRLSSIEGVSGSYSTTGSNQFKGNQTITGSLTITENLLVLGSSSITYITASQLNVSSSTISVNVFEPAERFGGLKIYDSGSSNATASFLWDSLNNRFVYQNVSGASYNGAMFIAGPRNTGSLGDELTLTSGKIPKSVGGDHIDNSIMSEVNGSIGINGGLVITGSILSTGTSLVSGSSQIDITATSNYTTFSSSIATINTNQDTKLGLLETSTGSLNSYTSSNNTRLNTIESTTSSINTFTSSALTRVTAIETSTGSLNTFTSSINTTIKSKLNTDNVVSGSLQVISLLPSGTVSGSSQVLNGTTIHSGSFFNGISVVSGSAQIDFAGIVNKPALVSGSAQIDFTTIANKPALISDAVQVDLTATTNYASGIKTRLDAVGVWSGSAQLPSGTVSGSAQVDLTNTTNYASGILTRLNTVGVLSGSAQVDLTATTNYASGILTRLNAVGVFSGSAQVTGIGNSQLTNSSFYVGTTSISLGRGSASQTLTGVSIDGNAATVTGGVYTSGDQTIAGIKTFSNRVVFNSAVANRPQLPGGMLGLDTGDGDFDIWGISRDYYPSHATAANAWGLRWNGANNDFEFVGGGTSWVILDMDGGNVTATGNVSATGTIGGSNFSGTHSGTSSGTNTGDQTTITGNAGTSTTFSTSRTNYKGVTDGAVAGQLMWKNYGNNHTIFDASNATAPDGTTVNAFNPTNQVENLSSANTWGQAPTLMGWNGSSTYGVKVDYARYANTAGNITAYTINQSVGTSNSPSFARVTLTDGTNTISIGQWDGSTNRIESANRALFLTSYSSGVYFGMSGSVNYVMNGSAFYPNANNTYSLGTATYGWSNIYTNDLHLSNMNKPEGNDIDGTNGNWTIQEGAENLYIINNNNGKKFKISLEEIK